MEGLGSHLGKIQSSLHLEKDRPMTLGISGPEIFPIDISLKLPRKVIGMFVVIHYDHGSKLCLQEQLLFTHFEPNQYEYMSRRCDV